MTSGIQPTKCWGCFQSSRVKGCSIVFSMFRFWWTIRALPWISQRISQWQPATSSPLWLLEKKWVSVHKHFRLTLRLLELGCKIYFPPTSVVAVEHYLVVTLALFCFGCIKIQMSVFNSMIRGLRSCSSCTIVWMRLLLCGAPLGFLLLTPSHCSESVNICPFHCR